MLDVGAQFTIVLKAGWTLTKAESGLMNDSTSGLYYKDDQHK
jgi:hypothetical protein